MYEVRVRRDRRPRFTDEIEPRIVIGTADAWCQVGMEGLLIDPDGALRRVEMLRDKLRLDCARFVGPGRGGAQCEQPYRVIGRLRIGGRNGPFRKTRLVRLKKSKVRPALD